MKINEQTSLLQDVPFHCSPNQDERPKERDISLLVVHGISLPPDDFGSGHIHEFFMNQLDTEHDPYFEQISHLKVSCHLFINRQGEVTQYVPFNRRAWHAGRSNFKGREDCNDFSIGIELEGSDHIPYTDAQYKALAKCTRALMEHYDISIDNIAGHSDIAPERKSDPGLSFDWPKFRQLLKELNN